MGLVIHTKMGQIKPPQCKNYQSKKTISRLVANSTSISKRVQKENTKFFILKDLLTMGVNHVYAINEDTVIDGSTIHAIRVKKQTDKHFNFALFGIHILSMSKRIMNEVMTLAEDIGCDIYYQDTDSMFVDAIKLPILKEEFMKKYNRELSGKQMGQFESDFTSMNGRSDVQYASESIFLMKKMYMNQLRLQDGSIDYMYRGKGLTQKCILMKAKKFVDENDSIC